jgi:hypothetical protein
MTTPNSTPHRSHAAGDMRRREFLKTALGTASLGVLSSETTALSQDLTGSWVRQVCDYLEGLRRPDGGYVWPDQPRSHLTPSFAAVGCYHLLRREPPEKRALVEFLRTHHPFHLKKLERDLRVFEFQQIQSLLWLGEDVGSFREQVRNWTKPSVYPTAYEKHGYPILRLEAMSLLCRQLVGLAMDDVAPAFGEYFQSRQRPNGSFNNTPAADGGDGHVMNTWWAIQALEALGRPQRQREDIIAWVQRCQTSGGGFTWQPKPAFAGVEDVTYTWAAVRILKRLDASPVRREACIDHLRSLWNTDVGFGARPGWPSNPEATYRALNTLHALDALGSLSQRTSRTRTKPRPKLPGDLKVFTVQIEAHGRGSCVEAVELARALPLGLHDAGPAEDAAGGIAQTGDRWPGGHADPRSGQGQVGSLSGPLPLSSHCPARRRPAHGDSHHPRPYDERTVETYGRVPCLTSTTIQPARHHV